MTAIAVRRKRSRRAPEPKELLREIQHWLFPLRDGRNGAVPEAWSRELFVVLSYSKIYCALLGTKLPEFILLRLDPDIPGPLVPSESRAWDESRTTIVDILEEHVSPGQFPRFPARLTVRCSLREIETKLVRGGEVIDLEGKVIITFPCLRNLPKRPTPRSVALMAAERWVNGPEGFESREGT